ncbi:MAG: two pore domain potassium channel family protein [Microthrixaceae bacterium]|nr:two pore domain potassium channel family protein [Acidimicrobiales bacterium]MCB9403407.1 two pore domain potassium channel family protein [Microthrixaceae bacterium]
MGRTTRFVDDIRRLMADDDVVLESEAPGWLIVLRFLYELGLLMAAVGSAWLLLLEGRGATTASWLIWAWFATDYGVRVYVANDRADYIRRHRIELVAALPLDLVRPARLLRLLRPLAMVMRATKGLRDVLGLTGIRLIAAVGAAVVCAGGALLPRLDPGVASSFGDGLWWAVVTTTTVGYGDISPTTTGGRVLAAALMIAGIGMLGALTGEVAERFLAQRNAQADTSGDADVDHVRDRLLSWSMLSATERRQLAALLHTLAVTVEQPATEPDPNLTPGE